MPAEANRSRGAAGLSSPLALSLVVTLLALAVRLYGLGDKPFWLDEILTLKRASLPLAELALDSLRNRHYPTYFLLVRPFTSAGMNELVLRLPSAVFGALSVLVVTLAAGELRGLRAGLVAGLLMALSPFEVQFGQEARSYALISCLIMLALWGLLRIKNAPEAAALPVSRPGSLRGAWAAYTLCTAAALLVQNIALPWLIVSNLAALAIVRAAASRRKELLRNWMLSQAIILLLWLPGFIVMLSINRGDVMSALRWVPATTWENVWVIAGAVYLFRVSDLMTFMLLPAPLPGFGFAVAAMALFGAWRLRHDPIALAVIGSAFLAMPIAIAVLTAYQPILVPRYLMWSTGPYFVLAGIGAAALPTRFFTPAAAIAALGAALSLAPYYTAETKPRWDHAAAYLADRARPNDVIVARGGLTEFVFRAFARRYHLDPAIPIFAWDPNESLRRAAEGKRAWIIYGRTGQGAIETEQEFRKRWTAFGEPAEEIRFGSHILMLRFDLDEEGGRS